MNKRKNYWLYSEEYIVAIRVVDTPVSYILACFKSEKDANEYKENTEKIIINMRRTDIEAFVEPIKVFPLFFRMEWKEN